MNAIGVGAPDGFEIGCDNGDKVRIAFALDASGSDALSPGPDAHRRPGDAIGEQASQARS